jgi:hypothetical protein
LRSDLSAFDIAQGFQRMIFGTMITWSLAPVDPLEESMKRSIELFVNGVLPK